MKLIIFSDSHGFSSSMEKVIRDHINTCGYFIFLGDGIREFCALSRIYSAEKPECAFVSVAGNCDFSSALLETVLDIEGRRIFVCHGHNYSVKHGTSRLIEKCREEDCDIGLFGHTHCPCEEYLGEGKPLYIFNPGSISQPRDGRPSFGIIDICGNNLLFSNATLG